MACIERHHLTQSLPMSSRFSTPCSHTPSIEVASGPEHRLIRRFGNDLSSFTTVSLESLTHSARLATCICLFCQGDDLDAIPNWFRPLISLVV